MSSLRRSVLVLCAALLLAAAVIAATLFFVTRDNWAAPEAAKTMQNRVAENAATLAAGRAIYGEKCMSCHGVRGDGHGDQAQLYATKPANFRDATEMNRLTDGELFWKISQGRRPMPGFKNRLSEDERWELVRYIRKLAARDAARDAAGPAATPSATGR